MRIRVASGRSGSLQQASLAQLLEECVHVAPRTFGLDAVALHEPRGQFGSSDRFGEALPHLHARVAHGEELMACDLETDDLVAGALPGDAIGA